MDKPDIPAHRFLICLLTLCAHIVVRRHCTLDLSVVGTISFRGGFQQSNLFDTFEGIPEVGFIDTSNYQGEFSASFESCKKIFQNERNLVIFKGIFPDSAVPILDKTFSFVHLDVDTYKSTLDCLNFFYPRISKGGIILSHDYLWGPGVKKAFDEFFSNKLEVVLETGGTQCLVVKL